MDHPPAYDATDATDAKAPLEKEPTPAYEECAETGEELAESSSQSTRRGPKLAELTIDATKPLVPNRVFWIPWFSLLSKHIEVFDMSTHMDGHWQGAVNKEYRELTEALYKKYKKSDQPLYTARAKDTLRYHYSFRDASNNELVDWKHGWHSLKDVHLTFPQDSKHSSGPVDVVKANKTFTRDRYFAVDGVGFATELDHNWRSNQFTLYKIQGNQKVTVGRWGMKYGGWFAGSVLVIDNGEVDEPIAVLSALIMMKQGKQRAGERSSNGGGGAP